MLEFNDLVNPIVVLDSNAVLTNNSFKVVDANKLVTLVPANAPVQLDVNRQITEFDPESFEYK